uniref:Protein sleepless n=1 Tax=Steinernema glaseri TaxID=37863 RepID=A0A1I7YXM5_9BILA
MQLQNLCFSIVLLDNFLQTVRGFGCFECASEAHSLPVTLRRALGSQSDLFYWPLEATAPNCHGGLADARNLHQVQAGLCSRHDLCVSLMPNANVNFTVRGCVEQILRYPLRENSTLLKEGCYLVRSKPLFDDEMALDYIVCVCGRQEYCNHEPQMQTVDAHWSPGSSVYRLGLDEPKEGVKKRVIAAHAAVSNEVGLSLAPGIVPLATLLLCFVGS